MGNKQASKKVVYFDNSTVIEAEAKNKTKLQLENERQLKEAELVKNQDRNNDLFYQAALQRRAILDYKFGDKHGMGSFSSLDISEFTDPKARLRIALMGPAGVGKSSFINTCERTIKIVDKGSCEVFSGGEGTVRLQDYLGGVCAFRLVDVRGFQNMDQDTLATVREVVDGNIRPGEVVKYKKSSKGAKYEVPLLDRIHGVICCTSPMDPYLRDGSVVKLLDEFRNILRERGITPVIVITHKDMIENQEQREQMIDKISAATATAKNHVFFLRNYTPEFNQRDPTIELDVFRVLHSALVTAERFVKIAKQRMMSDSVTSLPRAASYLSLTSATFDFERSAQSSPTRSPLYENVQLRASKMSLNTCSIQEFFRHVTEEHNLPESEMAKLQSDLLRLGVRTLAALVRVWEKVSKQMIKDVHIKTCIATELDKQINSLPMATIL
ncbi:uncharacterized protein [Ptychodera flava]|uniref:uncharacterized protein isoform X2 n=1 Tax=Ptychodera flava TaxID=63121 RepID=UPI00396A5A28